VIALAKYRFKEIKSAEDLLKAIGRTDIPSTKVVIRSPAIDEETGEVYGLEIDFGEYTLTPADEAELEALMKAKGLMLRRKI
jgi:hypothetical protein